MPFGSDTAIWDGMDTSLYHCHYNIDLYTKPVIVPVNAGAGAYNLYLDKFQAVFIAP